MMKLSALAHGEYFTLDTNRHFVVYQNVNDYKNHFCNLNFGLEEALDENIEIERGLSLMEFIHQFFPQ